MRYLIVRTEVRPIALAEINAQWDDESPMRDEVEAPEPRRQTAEADSLDAALRLARALASDAGAAPADTAEAPRSVGPCA